MPASWLCASPLYHRHSYTGCKPGIGDVIMGTTALLADYQNINKTEPHQGKAGRDDQRGGADIRRRNRLCCEHPARRVPGPRCPTLSLQMWADATRAITSTMNSTPSAIVAGGLPATVPMTKEYNHPEVGKFVQKYVTRRNGHIPLRTATGVPSGK